MNVWIATELHPESTVVLVGATEDAALRQIVAHIGRADYEEFTASLKGSEQTGVTYDDHPRDVLRVWAGDFEPDGKGGFYVGDEWLVREREVAA